MVFVSQERKAVISALQRGLSYHDTNSFSLQSRLLQSFLDSSPQSYILLDTRHRIILFNEIAARLVLDIYDKTLERNTVLFDYLPEQENRLFRLGFEQAMLGEVVSMDYSVRQKYVGNVWYDVNMIPVYSDDNALVGVGFTALDITHRRRTQEIIRRKNEELIQANQRLTQLNQVKDKLFSIIAHDFRGPLNNLKSTLPLLDEDVFEPIQRHTLLTELERQLDNTMQGMENVLQWAKSQINGIEHRPAALPLGVFVAEIMDLLAGAASAKNIALHNEVAANVAVWADENMLKVILHNLLSNAIKFTQDAPVYVRAALLQDEMVEISVQDTGVGMSADILAGLFLIGKHQSSLGTAYEKGTGLGLLLCKEFVERNGGTIRVSSIEGQGSTFTFTLPIAPDLPSLGNTANTPSKLLLL